MKIRIKVLRDVDKIVAYQEVSNNFLFKKEKKICTFDWLETEKNIVEILRKYFFEQIKSNMILKIFYDGKNKKFRFYSKYYKFKFLRNLYSIDFDYLSDIDDYIKDKYSSDLEIKFEYD